MAPCRLAKSALGHQPPGTALRMAFQLDLAGNTVSDLGCLQDVPGKRRPAVLHVVWLHEFCCRDGSWDIPPARRVYRTERAGWGPVAVQHCPGELFCPGRMGLDLAPPHCAASRLCVESRWPQCRPGSILVQMALTVSYRPNGPWEVSTLLDVRDNCTTQTCDKRADIARRTGRTPHAYCEE